MEGGTGMQGKGLISVIVPVYNVEQYLSVCVRSILQQSYSNLEILLVDDGSTDGSGRLCDAWQEKDERIRVFHQKNGGLSAARNTGMEKAEGEFLCFVDSDDWIHSDYLKILYENILAFDADVSCCRYRSFSDESFSNRVFSNESFSNGAFSDHTFFHGAEGAERVEDGTIENAPRLCTREYLWDTLTDVGADCRSTWLVVAWNKLIRREVLKDLAFPVGKWHEDEFFIHRLLLRINSFVDTSAQLYFYRKRAEGICGDKNRLDMRHLDMVDAWEERVKVYRSESRKAERQRKTENRMVLYHKMVAAYRMTIRIQYGNFDHGMPAIWLKLRYLWSYFQYPEVKWHLGKILRKDWE